MCCIGGAVFVAVEDLQESAGGRERPQSAEVIDRKQRILERPAVEILGPERQAAERHRGASRTRVAGRIDLQRIGHQRCGSIEVDQRGDAGAGVDREEITVAIDAVELATHNRHAGDDAQAIARVLDRALGSPGLPYDGGGGPVGRISSVEPGGGAADANRVVEQAVGRRACTRPGDGIDDVGGEGVRRAGETVGHGRNADTAHHDGAGPHDGDHAGAAIDVARLRRLQAYWRCADGTKTDHAAGASREVPRACADNGVRVLDGSRGNRRDAGLRQGERAVRRGSALLGRQVALGVARACRLIGDGVVAEGSQCAGAGIDQAHLPSGVGRAREPAVAIQLAVGTHHEVA